MKMFPEILLAKRSPI